MSFTNLHVACPMLEHSAGQGVSEMNNELCFARMTVVKKIIIRIDILHNDF
jgi:hypothetical protein